MPVAGLVEVECEYPPPGAELGQERAESSTFGLGVALELAIHGVNLACGHGGLADLRFERPLNAAAPRRCCATVDPLAQTVAVTSVLSDDPAAQPLTHLLARPQRYDPRAWHRDLARVSMREPGAAADLHEVARNLAASAPRGIEVPSFISHIEWHTHGISAALERSDVGGYRLDPAVAECGVVLAAMWLQRRQQATGFGALSAQALHLLEPFARVDSVRLVAVPSEIEGHPETLVLTAESERRIVAFMHGLAVSASEDAALVRRAPPPLVSPGELARSLADEPQRRRKAECERYLSRLVLGTLGRPTSEAQLSNDISFRDLGLSSMQATAVASALCLALGVRVVPTLLFDHPTIGALAEAVLRLLSLDPRPAPSARPSAPRDGQAAGQPIAVIGMACRLPGGAHTPKRLWELLCSGGEAITAIPTARKRLISGFETASWPLGALPDIEHFDASFFGISEAEAVATDPQHRMLLELTWDALEDAGITPSTLAGSRTGVFVSTSVFGYSSLLRELDAYSAIGNEPSAAAGRLSYFFGLRGPSVCVDTACSSSLVAICLASDSLRNGTCDLAIVGGASLVLDPRVTASLDAAGVLSRSGKARTFDAAADGYVRGEGSGVVVLRRLRDADAAHDDVRAVIRGYAVAHGGRSNGIAATNKTAQKELIEAALLDAGVDAGAVGFVEAHGAATPVGDTIELQALAETYGAAPTRKGKLLVGSVKPNIGHLETAAGIAGFIKSVLCLGFAEVPRNLNLEIPNPALDWDRAALEIPREQRRWPEAVGARFAAVNSFGMSGTYAHVVLEAARDRPAIADVDDSDTPKLVAITARDEGSLRSLAAEYAEHLRANEVRAQDLAFTAGRHREHFAVRASVVARSNSGLVDALAEVARGGVPVRRVPSSLRKVAFLYPGHGSHYAGMGRVLYEREAVFRRAFHDCDDCVKQELGVSLREVLYGDPAQAGLLRHTRIAHPAIVAVECALTQLWASWGVEPDYVLGHSLGEYAAAQAASILSIEDTMRLVARRSRLMEAAPGPGAMAAINASPASVSAALRPWAGEMDIAAINAPDQVVVSGARAAVEAFCAEMRSLGIRTYRLPIDQGAHSALMDSILDEFARDAGKALYRPARIPIVSSVTATLGAEQMRGPEYFRDQLRRPVLFWESIERLRAEGVGVMVEAGAQPLLLGAVASFLDEGCRLLPSLQQGANDSEQILASAGELFCEGITLDWAELPGVRGGRRARIPAYSFARRRYWPGCATSASMSMVVPASSDAGVEPRESASFAAEMSALAPAERLRRLVVMLKRELRQVLSADCSEEALDQSFADLGLNSLALIQLRSRLHRLTGITLAASAFVSFPDVRTLAEQLARSLECDRESRAG